MLEAIAAAEAAGLTGDEAVLAAFEWRTQGKPLPEPATINASKRLRRGNFCHGLTQI